jgi:N-acetylmuramoyl-L-alanine amidase
MFDAVLMPIHIVEQGEYFSSIAQKYGFTLGRTIYEHEQNAELRQRRPNPNILCPGDEVFVPEKTDAPKTVPTGKTHKFKLTGDTIGLKVKVAEHFGPPLKGRPYTLKIGDNLLKGNVPDSGIIEHNIPVGLPEVELRVFAAGAKNKESCYHWVLKIGHLDPVDTISGIQARLNNLGFYAGPVDGEDNPTTRTAVRQFQRAHKLLVDEVAGPKTQQKLKEVYGC